MAPPFNITKIVSLAAGAKNVSLISDVPQRVMDEDSVFDLAISREVVEIDHGVEVGSDIAMPRGSVSNVNTTNGTLPKFDTDNLGRYGARAGQEIAIFASNTNAAAKEIRLQVRITSLEDLAILPANVA